MDDATLVEKCRNGSRTEQEQAWTELVSRHGKRIFNVAFHFTYRTEEAEELTQEIYLKLWQHLDRYDGRQPLVAWVLGISRNHCIDHYRKFRKEKGFQHLGDDVLALIAGPTSPGEDLDRKERLAILLQAIERLSEELAEVLILRDLDDLAYGEIGTILSLPEGTVKSRINRARVELAAAVREIVGLPAPASGSWRGRGTEVN
jgi:RNA polymerase sigma-70 factor (ECF subfamily)